MLAENDWLQALIALAAGVTALGILWRKVFKPLWHAACEFTKSASTLHEIADQFRPNHGSSLVDRLAKIEHDISTVRGMSKTALDQHDALGVKVQQIIDRMGPE